MICGDLKSEAVCVDCIVEALTLDEAGLRDFINSPNTSHDQVLWTAAMARHYVMLLEAYYELRSDYGVRMQALFFDAPLHLLYAYVLAALSTNPMAWLDSEGNRSVLENALGLAWHMLDVIGERDPGVRNLAKGLPRLFGDKAIPDSMDI